MRESVQGRRFRGRVVDAKIVINRRCCHPTPGLGKKEFSVRRSDQKLEKKVTLDENFNSGPPIKLAAKEMSAAAVAATATTMAMLMIMTLTVAITTMMTVAAATGE